MASYQIIGPPFNFSGTLSETQWDAFKAWTTERSSTFAAVQQHHQMRAQQLRKTAGLLEQHYAVQNDEALAPTFVKTAWSPPKGGYWPFALRDDHTPATVVSAIKGKFAHRLQRQDDAVFHMNHLRAQIERQEDQAQYAAEAPAALSALISQMSSLFGQPEYQNALVRDKTDLYQGEPRFRVHALDPPTAWERVQNAHAPI